MKAPLRQFGNAMKNYTWFALFSLTLGVCCVIGWLIFAGTATAVAHSDANLATANQQLNSSAEPIRVDVVAPQSGGLERITTQPGSVIAFESARLFAKLSGYLKTQNVDIGDRVKRGQVLAELDAPELLKEVDQNKAALEQAQAQVLQAEARVATASAEHDAALATIKKAEADIEKTLSFRTFREKQYKRFLQLVQSQSIEERLVDEKLDELEAARAAERLAHANVADAKAQAAAAAARINQAKADVTEARAKVDVAKSALGKAEVIASYLSIVSPYDGVITRREFFPGDFIQSADKDASTPLLAVDRTDLMRVVVQVPDQDVPFTNPGQPATVEIDALPGTRFSGKVERVADAEDPQSRTMRAEIDLPNDKLLLRQGMYGRVTIQLGASRTAVRIPSSSLVGDVNNANAKVYVCRDGVVHLSKVRIGLDDGVQAEVLEGLDVKDQVVRDPGTSLYDGARVTVTEATNHSKADKTR